MDDGRTKSRDFNVVFAGVSQHMISQSITGGI